MKVLGKGNPKTINGPETLALILERQRKYEEAEMIDQENLDLRDRVLGEAHRETSNSVLCLARVWERKETHEEAS